jgi:hypothetical protein
MGNHIVHYELRHADLDLSKYEFFSTLAVVDVREFLQEVVLGGDPLPAGGTLVHLAATNTSWSSYFIHLKMLKDTRKRKAENLARRSWHPSCSGYAMIRDEKPTVQDTPFATDEEPPLDNKAAPPDNYTDDEASEEEAGGGGLLGESEADVCEDPAGCEHSSVERLYKHKQVWKDLFLMTCGK